MTPAEELRAAAERLEALAAETTPGPWEHVVDDHGRKGLDPSVWSEREHADGSGYGYVVEYVTPRERSVADTVWIAVLGPQVAAPLAAWLRAEAVVSESMDTLSSALPKLAEAVEEMATGGTSPGWRLRLTSSSLNEALAFARVVTGATS